ncbi:cullin-3 [Anaeramoeba flamelloides]|uniref:Cullin-3 n=1 Tax=Anaeramoeba flamelloides TaxID=1746091 RepID=A0AAV7Y2I6_9EUKA|nr:cullin-3 [Anaeramoeba flamelloides]
MYDEYLRNHLETLKYMESGPIMMLKKFQTEELHVVYTFFTAIGEKEWLLECLFTGFSKLGNQILDKFENNTKDLQNYYTIKELISLRKGCIKLLINSFENDQDFYHKIDQCFFKFINNNDQSSQVAKNLPKFMDYEIRYLKKKTENEIEELFEYFIQIFKFVSEKDVFKKYYEFFLSRRLVSSYNIDEEIEKKIILKLKLNSWSNFTLKMEDMIKNVQASKENYLEFQKYQKTAMSGENIIHIMPWIVKQSIWPVSLKINCILPKMLSNNLNVFNEFYQKQHSGHILKWQFNVGSSEMIFSLYSVTPITPSTKSPLPIFKTGKAIKEKKYNFKNYLLIVSPFQMIILLQFNSLLKDSPPTYSFQELIQLTGIPEKTMKITLSGLCTKKYPILKRISYSKDNIQEFKYTINLKFKNSQRRFKLMKISQNYSETNKNVNMHWVKKEREVLLESMIMKIMKSRRVIKHKELIFELTKLLKDKFIPSITMIKQRTNNLIDREYIEKDVNLYRYLA